MDYIQQLSNIQAAAEKHRHAFIALAKLKAEKDAFQAKMDAALAECNATEELLKNLVEIKPLKEV